jgi:low affinity Fe/Cu permease
LRGACCAGTPFGRAENGLAAPSERDSSLVAGRPEIHRGSLFDRFARQVAHYAGHPLAFAAAVSVIVLWIVSGPAFGFSDTWQLVINTATTIVTFLMVFVIQDTQNRDGQAIQIKLDELIRVVDGAHNGLLDLEELSEAELGAFKAKYLELAEEARKEIRRGQSDTGSPEIDF